VRPALFCVFSLPPQEENEGVGPNGSLNQKACLGNPEDANYHDNE